MEAECIFRSAIRLMVAAFLFGLLWFAPAAASAAVLDLSDEARAREPAIVVDEAGTSHIVWNVSILGSDDDLVYCRLPRSATGCAKVERFNLPGEDFDGPKVVITRDDEIVVTTRRCCFPASPVLAISSANGGDSFGPPVTIASEFGQLEEAAPGPGDFSLALSGGNSGPDYSSIWRAAPLDGSSPAGKALLSPFPKAYSVSTGFPDPTSPIVAYSDLNQVFFRTWDGDGSYNDVANWLPEGTVGNGDEPKLASGVRGVFLIYRGNAPPNQYYVRSYDDTGFPASGSRVVSDPASGQPAIFRDFTEDGDGNLHAVFRQRTTGNAWQLVHRVSRDGNRSWQEPAVLASGAAAETLYHLRVAAAPDGGGGIVADDNGGGQIRFLPFATLANTPGTCKPSVKLGKGRVRALKGCFKRPKKSKTWVASGPVKVNGIDIDPKTGGSASGAAGFKVFANPATRILKTNRAAKVHAGAVQLDTGNVNWKFPAGDGKVTRLGTADGSVFKNLGKFTRTLFELPVTGDAELLVKGTGTEIPAHFRMPGILGSVTGNTTFRTDQSGLDLGGLKIDVPKAAIGLLRLAGINITYDGANRFTGHARIALPPQYSKSIAEVTVGVEDGELSLLKVEPPPFTPTLPIIGSPPSPMVGLDRVDFSYIRKPASRLFQGGLYLIGGPKLAGNPIAQLDGNVSLEFPSSGPTTLSAGGKLKVVKVPLGGGSAKYTVGFPGNFEFGGHFSLLNISGNVDGFIDLSSGKFSGSAQVSSGILDGEAVISSYGFAACISVPGPPPDFGFTWKWGDLFPSVPICSDVGSFKVSPPKTSVTRTAAAPTATNIPGGQTEAAIAVLGAGGAPAITVTGPEGEIVAGGAVTQGRYRITPVPAESRTIVQIGDPVGGDYAIAAQPGSVPVERVLTARGLPEPKAVGRVRGKGHRLRFSFKLKRIDGQRVTFAEQGKDVYREIAVTKRAKGLIGFKPAPGPAGRRRIIANVAQNGLPRARFTVTRYRAPMTARPHRPKRVRALRRGRTLVVKWRRLRSVHGYRVRVALPRDGRRLLFFPGPRKSRLKVQGIEPTDLGRIQIAGIGPDARPGRSAVARLRVKGRRHHRHHKHRR